MIAGALHKKIGVHLLMWQKDLISDVVPFLRSAKNAGFDGAEISLARYEHLQIPDILKEAQTLNLKLTCSFSLSPEFDIASGKKNIAQPAIDRFKTAIDHAVALKSPILVGPWYSGLGVWSENASSREKRLANSMKNIGKVVEHASDNGIVLGLEVLNRYETDLINTVKQAKEYIDQVDNQTISIHLDTFHSSIEEKSVPDAILEAGTSLGHIHLAENHRGIPGSGCLPWEKINQELQSQNYQGWYVVEVIGDVSTPIADQFHYWGRELPPPDESARMAYKFIKDLIA